MSNDFGAIKCVNLRTAWNNEAQDFTPWLAKNIQRLNEAVGLELEVKNTEVAAGPYSADILAIDTGTGRYVVIENQLEKTDHDHLGKAITYASVLDASTIVWIAADFTEEHQRALDWLNDHSSGEIMFYGVQIELWQIDDSKSAPRFSVVSKPNLAVRQAAKNKGNEELTDTTKFQLAFWEQFRDKLKETGKIRSLQTPAPRLWYDVPLGRSGILLSLRCNYTTNTVVVCVYIRNTIVDTMLPFLEERKESIESDLGDIGSLLRWNPNPNKRDKTINLDYQTDFSDPIKREEALDWLVAHTILFHRVFSRIIKDYRPNSDSVG
jgi:hypothetical protein